MTPLSQFSVQEAVSESPCLVQRLDGTVIGPRATEHMSDFGDMASVGKRLCVGGDETYKGVFVGHSLRFGFVVGILLHVQDSQYAIMRGEAFKTREEMLGRWIIE